MAALIGRSSPQVQPMRRVGGLAASVGNEGTFASLGLAVGSRGPSVGVGEGRSSLPACPAPACQGSRMTLSRCPSPQSLEGLNSHRGAHQRPGTAGARSSQHLSISAPTHGSAVSRELAHHLIQTTCRLWAPACNFSPAACRGCCRGRPGPLAPCRLSTLDHQQAMHEEENNAVAEPVGRRCKTRRTSKRRRRGRGLAEPPNLSRPGMLPDVVTRSSAAASIHYCSRTCTSYTTLYLHPGLDSRLNRRDETATGLNRLGRSTVCTLLAVYRVGIRLLSTMLHASEPIPRCWRHPSMTNANSAREPYPHAT